MLGGGDLFKHKPGKKSNQNFSKGPSIYDSTTCTRPSWNCPTPDYFKKALSSNEFSTSSHARHFKRDSIGS